MSNGAKNRQTTEFDGTLGRKVRAARQAIKMSQEELAERLGVTFQQVQKYEKGVNRISSERLIKISDALGKPVDWFLAQTGGDDAASLQGAVTDEVWDALGTADGILLLSTFARIQNATLRSRLVSLVIAVADAAQDQAPAKPQKTPPKRKAH